MLPPNVIGVLSDDNDNPIKYLGGGPQDFVLPVVLRQATHLVLQKDWGGALSNSYYLGAIVSPDRHTIYWTNRSRPLP